MHADYAASKGAMSAFVKSIAIEVSRRGITVNSVAPGWVDTEMCEDPFGGGGRDRIAAAKLQPDPPRACSDHPGVRDAECQPDRFCACRDIVRSQPHRELEEQPVKASGGGPDA